MLAIEHLTKSFSGQSAKLFARRRSSAAPDESVHAVRDVSFEVEQGELFTLLGPSGCGKTTTLRSIAGLERPSSGRISLGDRVLYERSSKVDVPSDRREIGMVFQSYAIWPHMTVYKNVAFPLEVARRGKRRSRAQIAEDVSRALHATELSDFADRPATKLSGGQQQRLALARALVSEPSLILLDEPLSNLDAKLRENMRFELKRLQRERGVTSVYVTHDQTEALALSSRIAVMRNGEIEQIGKPREIYGQPASRFVAEFVGVSNLVEGVVGEVVDGLTSVITDGGVLWSRSPVELRPQEKVVASMRPEAITISATPPANQPRNVLRGHSVGRAFTGDAVEYVVAVGPQQLRVRAHPRVQISRSVESYLCVDEEDVVLVPA